MNRGIITDLSELEYLLTDPGFISLDFETEGTHPRKSELVGFAVHTKKGVGYVPFTRPDRYKDVSLSNGILPSYAQDQVREVVNSLDIKQVPFLGWNIKFDGHCWRRLTGWFPQYVVDPMVGLWLLHEEAPLALKGLIEKLTSEPQLTYTDLRKRRLQEMNANVVSKREAFVDEHHIKRRKGMLPGMWTNKLTLERQAVQRYPTLDNKDISTWDIPCDILGLYCCKDTLIASWVWFTFIQPNLAYENMETYFYTTEMPFLRTLANMEWEGIELDVDKLSTLGVELGKEIESSQAKLKELAGWDVNFASNKQLQTLLFEQEKLDNPTKKTKTGMPSVDANSLNELREMYPDNEILSVILELRDTTKVKSTFCDGLPKELYEGNLHTEYKQVGAVTGRLSSSDPNLQNITKKRELRTAFRSRKGYCFIKADYSQAELRVLAHRSNDPILLETYRSGGDLHQSTLEKLSLSDRRMAKVVNFGTVYGSGPTSYQAKLKWEYKIERSWKDCKKDLDSFYEIHKGVTAFKERVWSEGRRLGYVTTCLGRKRHLPFTSDDSQERTFAERQGVNVLIQGDVSDILRVAMVRLDEALPKRLSRLLLQVHDELLVECPIFCAKEVAMLVKEIMQNAITLSVPLIADVEIGYSWGDTVPMDQWEVAA